MPNPSYPRLTGGSASSFDSIFGTPQRSLVLQRGSYLFRRGEAAAAVFAVEIGRLRLERNLEDGTPITLAVLGPGDGIAEAALFAPTYHCDARAEVRSRLRAYAKADALEALRSDGAGTARLLQRLAGQVRRLRAILELRAVRRADERVLAYLDLLAALDESWDGERPVSAVAAEIGLTPEALYRALGRLEKTERIVRQGRRVSKKT